MLRFEDLIYVAGGWGPLWGDIKHLSLIWHPTINLDCGLLPRDGHRADPLTPYLHQQNKQAHLYLTTSLSMLIPALSYTHYVK